MESTGLSIYPYEDKPLTREEVQVIVAEAHVWQKRADLRGANLQEANLSNTHLECANLEDANLRRAVMRGVFLNQANLRGAVLPLSFKERLSQYLRDRSHRFEQLN